MTSNAINKQPLTAPNNTYVWYVIWLMFAVNMLNYIDRMVLAVLIEDIRVEIPMSDSEIGILTGLAFAIFYAIAGLFLGRMSDKYSRKRILVGAIGIWSLATAACGLAANFVQMLFARISVGFGEAGAMPASQSMLADYCNVEKRSAAYAIQSAGATLGLMVGLAGGGWIAELYGWRAAFFIAGSLGIPIALIIAITLREPQRGVLDVGANTMEGSSFKETLLFLWRKRSFPLILMSSSCIAFMMFGVAQWVPAFLIRSYGLSTAEVGAYFGVATGVGSALGAITGGLLCNFLVARNIKWLLTLPILVGLTVVPFYEIALFAGNLKVTIAMIFVVNFVGSLGYGPIVAAFQSVVPAGMRATATAIYGLVTSLLGVGLAPFAIGVMSDIFGQGAQDAASLQKALAIAVIVGAGTSVFLFLARRTFEDDLVVPVKTESEG